MKASGVWAAMAVSGLLIGLAGCGQFSDVSAFEVVNDTPSSVTITMCGNSCQQTHGSEQVRVGGSTEFNGTVGGPSEDFMVRGSGYLRCLTVLVPHGLTTELKVKASSAVACTAHQMRRGSWWDRHFG